MIAPDDADAIPHSDGPIPGPPADAPAAAPAEEPLPQQEAYWRAPARFGSVPVDAYPKGYDRYQRFRKLYPPINLPIQVVERVPLGAPELEPNRLLWGDCLHVMRQLPSASIDLIYIDPPFFSGRDYNVIWGDANELRSFTDIWEGGMDGYLIWLNARLYEMKRLLTPTGSIYVHCDWHASHYIKVEMDKIFGSDNFRNEIVWHHPKIGIAKSKFTSNTDSLLFYVKTDNAIFTPQTSEEPNELSVRWSRKLRDMKLYYREAKTINDSPARSKIRVAERRLGRRLHDDDVVVDFNLAENKKSIDDVWKIPFLRGNSSESQGYPTQKPESLLEYVIQASSRVGAVVADFFIGGGTTAAVAQRLGRRFIACDQSRVAVAVTAERLKQAAITRAMEAEPYPDFTVEQWGIYEADRLSKTPPDGFREFVLRAYGAVPSSEYDGIHGWHNRLPVWVGESALDSQASAVDVQAFANAIRRTTEYQQAHLRDGAMLAWGFDRGARGAARELREREQIDVNFVNLRLLRIGDADFRERIVGASTDKADYSEFLTFVQPPVVSVGYKALGGRAVTLDAGDSVVVNRDAKIINAQWDFAYDGQRFTATPGYSFSKDKKPQLQVTHKFERAGKVRVACRVQDSRGGEGLWSGEVEVK